MGMLDRVWLAAVFTLVVSAARAEEGRFGFNLPAQPLAAALTTYAQQADIELIYAAELVAGKQSPALAGQYTAREALERLLASSGLRGDLAAEGTATITAEGTDPPPHPTRRPAPARSVLSSDLLARINRQFQTYYTSLDLTGRFDTWGIGHTLLLGGDYYRSDLSSAFIFARLPDIPSRAYRSAYRPVRRPAVPKRKRAYRGLLRLLCPGPGQVACWV